MNLIVKDLNNVNNTLKRPTIDFRGTIVKMITMTEKSRSKHEITTKNEINGGVAHNMGHILYMAQLTGNIDKKILINSVPKHERERYSLAFETLVKDAVLVPAKEHEKEGNYRINPKRAEDAKGLIYRFVGGAKWERKGEQILKNPFFHRGPIRDIEHFIGRYDVISHVFDRLRHTEDCSIVGPRAIGKTSLLHYISHEEVVRKYHLDPKRYIFVYCDPQRLSRNAKAEDFFYEMFSGTVLSIYDSGLLTVRDIKRINTESDNSINKINRSLFEIGNLERLLGALSERDYRIVYMFDEFEYIADNPAFDFSFYGQLRSLSGNPMFNVALVTASKKSLYDLTFLEEIKMSPFFRYFEDFKLGCMSKEEIMGFFDLAAENGVVFPNGMRKTIEEWSGRHPFLIQLACDYFFDLAANGKVLNPEEEEKHLKVFLSRHKKHFAYFWRQVNKEQGECLKMLASGKTLSSNCKDILDNLEESYLVVRKDGGYRIFSKAFERFVKGMVPGEV